MPSAQECNLAKAGARVQGHKSACHYLDADSAPVHMPGAQERNFAKEGARAQGPKYQPVITLLLVVRLFISPMPGAQFR